MIPGSGSDVAFSEERRELWHAIEGVGRDGGWLNEEILAQRVLKSGWREAQKNLFVVVSSGRVSRTNREYRTQCSGERG